MNSVDAEAIDEYYDGMELMLLTLQKWLVMAKVMVKTMATIVVIVTCFHLACPIPVQFEPAIRSPQAVDAIAMVTVLADWMKTKKELVMAMAMVKPTMLMLMLMMKLACHRDLCCCCCCCCCHLHRVVRKMYSFIGSGQSVSRSVSEGRMW
jgi:hypothetical protein